MSESDSTAKTLKNPATPNIKSNQVRYNLDVMQQLDTQTHLKQFIIKFKEDQTNSEPDRFAKVLAAYDEKSFYDVGFVKRLKMENEARLHSHVFGEGNEAEQKRLRDDHRMKLHGHTERRRVKQMQQEKRVKQS